MKSKIKAILLFSISILTSVSLSYCQNKKFEEKLNEYLSIQNKRIGFNGVVLVANEKEILYQNALGYSSIELDVPLTIDSKFKIASISKSFTGMLSAIAEKEGKLQLDDKIVSYFTDYDLNGYWKDITIRHLISHTSGIPHWNGFKDYWSIKSRFPLSTEQVLSNIFEMDLTFKAGSKVNYSSPAYFVLATILERIYEDTYSNILNEKIINPLKLKNTGEYNEALIIPKFTSGYHLISSDSLIKSPYRNMSALKGGGSLYSNSKDLLKWNRSIFKDSSRWSSKIISTLFEPTTNKTMPHNEHALYGMGWYIHKKGEDRPKAYQVAGGTFGYSSISVVYPEEKLTLIVLSNVSFLPVNNIWRDIEKIVFNKPFQLPKLIKKIELSNNSLHKFIGTYTAGNGMKLEILMHQNKLFTRLGNKPPFQVFPENEFTFYSEKVGIKFVFNILSDNKTVSGLKAEGRGQLHSFIKQK